MKEIIMYSLIMFLALAGGCQDAPKDHSVLVNTHQSYCCKSDKCECIKKTGKCECTKCSCVNCQCSKNRKTIRVSDVEVHVVPMDDGIIVDVDSDKTLPVDISYKKNKTGGYNVTVIVKDTTVPVKTKVEKSK